MTEFCGIRDLLLSQQCGTSLPLVVAPQYGGDKIDEESTSSGSAFSAKSTPITTSGFQLGPSSEGRVTGSIRGNKAQRRRPHSWKRRDLGREELPALSAPPSEPELMSSSKRKALSSLPAAEPKNKKVSDSTVASSLKLLPSQ
uniref:Uncharacterized protein n=1 Tax=Brassica campestris TaxID=3711 RepID=M4DCI0_BRACM